MLFQPEKLISIAIQNFQSQNYAKTKESLAQVLRVYPKNFHALHLMGLVLGVEENYQESVNYFKKALRINSGDYSTNINLARALQKSGQQSEAIAYHLAATNINPDDPEGWLSFGISLFELNRFEEALVRYRTAIEIEPRFTNAWVNLGFTLNELFRFDEALKCLNEAIRLSPEDAEAWCNKGVSHNGLHHYLEAISCFEKSIHFKPDYALAHYNLGATLQILSRTDEALANFDRAIALSPDYAQAYIDKCLSLLHAGMYEQAWDLYEWRWRKPKTYVRSPVDFPQPQWGGERTQNKLLIWGEQGVGDQVLYGGLLPELVTYPQHKVVALDRRLITLFERTMSNLEFVDIDRIAQVGGFDEQIPIGSLPRLLRPNKGSFEKVKSHYLLADKARVESLRPLITREGKRTCGVSWSSRNQKHGSDKSLGLTQMLTPLAFDALHFVNLQYGDTLAERQALQHEQGIVLEDVELVDNFNDIDGLAALIEACDLIITTSNTTAHLAGALGKETLLLLPVGKGKFWYWSGQERGRSIWYPSIRIYQQQTPGDWAQPLAQIRAYLETKGSI